MVDRNSNTETAAHDAHGHEPNSINVRFVVTSFIVLTIGIALSLLLMQGLRAYFATSAVPPALPAGQFVRGKQEPPEPRVVEDSPAQLRQLREENEAVLSSYAWVDRQNGIARIPIDRAMELLAEKGLASQKSNTDSDETQPSTDEQPE